jgi:hypothetical protein
MQNQTLLHPENPIPKDAEFVALDVETDATAAQNLVCVALGYDGLQNVFHANDETWQEILHVYADAGAYFPAHNARFDWAVLLNFARQRGNTHLEALIWHLFESGRVVCTMVREELIGVASPTGLEYVIQNSRMVPRKFSLDALRQRYLGRAPMAKGDASWQKRFGELLPFPVSQWPQDAIDYCLADIGDLVPLVKEQKRRAPRNAFLGLSPDLRVSPDEAFQVRASFALELMSLRGMGYDVDHAKRMEARLNAEAAQHRAALVDAGLMKRKWKTKNPEVLTKNAKACRQLVADAFEAAGEPVPTTDKGTPKTDADTLAVAAGLPGVSSSLVAWSALTTAEKMAKTYIRPVLLAAEAGDPIQSRYVTIKETGRTSCKKPNAQNLPRLSGMREIYAARPGHVLIAADYDTAELRALGQVCLNLFGRSPLAEFYQSDPNGDPHCMFAASLLNDGTTYDQIRAAHQAGTLSGEWAQARQLAKAVNFGAPGGLGAKAMVDYMAGYGVIVTMERAKELLEAYKETWEMGPYFRWVNQHKGPVYQHFTGRRRGRTTYCSRANTTFQGLIADVAKQAVWDVARAGLNLWAFVHDEIIIEAPEADCHAAAQKLVGIMENAAKVWMPNVPMTAGAHAMYNWSKKAKATYDKNGLLVADPNTKGWNG